MPQTIVDGARFHYRLEGDPAHVPIVLVHPIGADQGLWDAVVPLLTPWACVLRYDLRGHGGSETTSGEYSLQLMSSDLLALTSRVGFERFSAVGVSLGALAVLDAAACAPHRVSGMALCSAATRIAPPPGGWDGRAHAVRAKGMEPLGQPMVERMFSAGFRASRHPAIETTRSTLLRTDPEGYASACAVLRDADVAAMLPAISQPALIVSGEQDALTPPSAGKGMASAMPNARHAVLPGGHFPPLECPNELAGLLREAFADA
ncbi:alpha/beta fold hydrolase [Ramlibacter sp. G-1-2-2]|uniref:Alpha/beta fold hydrolase n=1 Tax=Ramlibacter agri TaxID=2728837 RepID=A0A848HDG1_9BURK|nr:alpha/beta fold hydrolase [Ramlibacter agri]NML47510.1 alpha/beta fold hydrolase [Ramlibacter agri]